jgi:hypothetical protein
LIFLTVGKDRGFGYRAVVPAFFPAKHCRALFTGKKSVLQKLKYIALANQK